MKVVHAAKFYPPVPGGMEAFVQTLAAGTADEWESVVVAAHTSKTSQEERMAGVRVVRAGAFGVAASVPLCPSLPLALWRERADCVVLHEPNPISGCSLFLHTPAKRLIIWHHSNLVRPWWAIPTYGRMQRALYRRADCVIVSNPVLAQQSALVRCARRVAVIPHGVDLPRYAVLTPAQLARAERLRSELRGPRFLFVGRFVYYKGLDVLIEAMTRCDGTLILVGDGPLHGAMRQQVAALALEHRVVFAGSVADEDLPAYYRASDVFVLPSVAESETYGLVQIEAMAAGVPVVSTSLPTGVPWVNQHDVTGLVVPPRDVSALAGALTTLASDAALRRTLGDGGRHRAESIFSRDRTVRVFRQLVETTVRVPRLLDEHLPQAESA